MRKEISLSFFFFFFFIEFVHREIHGIRLYLRKKASSLNRGNEKESRDFFLFYFMHREIYSRNIYDSI